MKRRALAGATALAFVATGCGATRHPPPTASTTATRPIAPATAVTALIAKPKPKPNPGSLPQTDRLPSPNTSQFDSEMAALWKGITENSMRPALPAFFPRAAYVQVKGIADPQADYVTRLLGEYRLDIGAAHDLLGTAPQAATLVGVRVPQSYAHWVNPGTCYNRIGYYEVPNARILYRQGGVVRSFGIASMISWRGVWYVVHLGSVLRASAAGVVDDPSSGPGESIPSSTC